MPPIDDEDALRRGYRIRVLGYQCRPSRELEASFQPFGYRQTTVRLQPNNWTAIAEFKPLKKQSLSI